MGIPQGPDTLESSGAHVSYWHLPESSRLAFCVHVQATACLASFWSGTPKRNIRSSQQYDEHGIDSIAYSCGIHWPATKRWS
jgi:hypothetical protein